MIDIKISSCTVGTWATNSYLISYQDNFIIVDPGDDFQKLENCFEQLDTHKTKTNIVILATHGHFDHVGAIDFFKKKYHCELGIHSLDRRILGQANLYRKIAGDKKIYSIPTIDFFLDNIRQLDFGSLNIKFHHIPGHSEGSVAIEINRCLFSGDVLLEKAIGRTDLPGGNRIKLDHSIKYLIDNFIDYEIYPGHGKTFVLTREKADFFQELIL